MLLESLENSTSINVWNFGIRRDIPKPPTIIIETILRVSAGIPLSLTIVERKSVKKVKLRINPVTTPIGLALPVLIPLTLDVRTIGKIGRIHGESTVIIPAKNANVKSNIIVC